MTVDDRLLLFGVALSACGPTESVRPTEDGTVAGGDDETESGSENSDEGIETGSAEDGDGGVTGESGDNGQDDCGQDDGWDDLEDGGGPEDGEGPASPKDYSELCTAQADQASCEAIPSESYPWWDLVTFCRWTTWYPVGFGGGECSLEEPIERCMGDRASEAGCGEEPVYCIRTNFETCRLEVSHAVWCGGCAEYCDEPLKGDCACHPDAESQSPKP